MSSRVNEVEVKIYRTTPIKNPGYANATDAGVNTRYDTIRYEMLFQRALESRHKSA